MTRPLTRPAQAPHRSQKNELRFSLRAKRRKMPAQKVFAKGFAVSQHVFSMDEFRAARVIASYVDFDNEVPTRSIIRRAFSLGHIVCVPRRHEGSFVLSFHRITDLGELILGEKGIMEPKASAPRVHPKKIDLVLVPGVGFDRHGNRLGFGSGYFDNSLPKMPSAFKVGLSYESCVMAKLPTEPHDHRMDALVTEKKVRRFGKSAQ